jgi:hypothetical protein
MFFSLFFLHLLCLCALDNFFVLLCDLVVFPASASSSLVHVSHVPSSILVTPVASQTAASAAAVAPAAPTVGAAMETEP